MNINPDSILESFIDWKDFEKFVAEMYKDSAEVTVQHNVTLIGQYGDKRQVDVLVTQTTKLHTYKTIIECKFLSSDKVNRPIVDVLAAAIEDLGVNKGVIITTVGYDAGAVAYAKGKNIDIFLIRNVLDEEWGNTGRNIKIWLQFFSAQIENVSLSNSQYHSLNGALPPSEPIKLDVKFSKDLIFEEKHRLYSFPEMAKGANLIKMFIDVQQQILNDLNDKTVGLLKNATNSDENVTRVFRTKVIFDFINYPFRFLKVGDGYIRLDNITASILLSISQSTLEIDRAKNFNYVLMVENYITTQKNFVAKDKETSNSSLSPPVANKPAVEDLRNGAVIKITTDFYVGISMPSGVNIENINDINVNLKTP